MDKPLTAEGRKAIDQRKSRKQKLLQEMREGRAAVTDIRHSHIGVELVSGISNPEDTQNVYTLMAYMSNQLYQRGHQGAGAVLGSIAMGMQRASVDRFGKERGQLTTRPVDQLEWPEPDTSEPQPESQPVADKPQSSSIPENPNQASTPDDTPAWLEAEAAKHGMSVDQLAEALENGELPGHDEPATSPEPEDSPQRQQAAKRRAKKASEKGNHTSKN